MSQARSINMKVFVTKWALTKGILEIEVVMESPTLVRAKNSVWECFHGEQWHTTLEAAEDQANSMRIKKIASLTAQIARLRQLPF